MKISGTAKMTNKYWVVPPHLHHAGTCTHMCTPPQHTERINTHRDKCPEQPPTLYIAMLGKERVCHCEDNVTSADHRLGPGPHGSEEARTAVGTEANALWSFLSSHSFNQNETHRQGGEDAAPRGKRRWLRAV